MGKNTGNGANIARFFYAAMGRVGWGITLGALPLRPWQEPEVPAPPGINTKPCSRAGSSALRANIAWFFYAAMGRVGDYVRGSAPKPRQEPEVPAPPGFYSKPCYCVSSSALRANIAQFFYALRRIGLR